MRRARRPDARSFYQATTDRHCAKVAHHRRLRRKIRRLAPSVGGLPALSVIGRAASFIRTNSNSKGAPHTLIGPIATNPCGKLASLRSRPFAPPHYPPSSGGSSERDGHRASPFGFGRTRGSRPSGRATRPAPHIASLPSSLPACLNVHAAPCACGLVEHDDGRYGLTVN
jgi:hypothetical protein